MKAEQFDCPKCGGPLRTMEYDGECRYAQCTDQDCDFCVAEDDFFNLSEVQDALAARDDDLKVKRIACQACSRPLRTVRFVRTSEQDVTIRYCGYCGAVLDIQEG